MLALLTNTQGVFRLDIRNNYSANALVQAAWGGGGVAVLEDGDVALRDMISGHGGGGLGCNWGLRDLFPPS